MPEAHNYDGNDTIGSAMAAWNNQRKLPDGSAYFAQKWTKGDRYQAMARVKRATKGDDYGFDPYSIQGEVNLILAPARCKQGGQKR
jgi:hypothetical protein